MPTVSARAEFENDREPSIHDWQQAASYSHQTAELSAAIEDLPVSDQPWNQTRSELDTLPSTLLTASCDLSKQVAKVN